MPGEALYRAGLEAPPVDSKAALRLSMPIRIQASRAGKPIEKSATTCNAGKEFEAK